MDNMKKKIIFLLLGFAMFTTTKSTAQAYFDQAVGLRAGSGIIGAVTYKKYVNASDAIEAIVGLNDGLINVGGAYQRHFPITDGFDWYLGGGASLRISDGNIGIGIEGYLGIQYVFDDIPLNLTLDWVPSVVGGNFAATSANLGIRYIF